jgi:hypothetical protein
MLEIDFSNSRLVLPSGFVAGIFYDLLLNLLEWKLDIDLNNHFKTFSLNSIIFIMYNNNWFDLILQVILKFYIPVKVDSLIFLQMFTKILKFLT